MNTRILCALMAACWIGGCNASTPSAPAPSAAAAAPAAPAAAAAAAAVTTATTAVAAAAGTVPYKVTDGNKVDKQTLNGWKTWRAMACERCHGAAQEGLVGPSLVDSLKVLTPKDFSTTVLLGRAAKGMPNFNGSKQVVDNIDNLYAYLKGRSDGAIKPGRLEEMGK